MNKKIVFLAIGLALVLALPIVIAATTQSQTIHVNGNAKYPHNVPAPTNAPTTTPTATSTSPTVQFSLFFPNGTAYPTSVAGAVSGGINAVVVDPMTGHNGGWIPTCVVVRNDGNVPISVNASLTNKNVPSNIDLTLNCGFYGTISGSYGSDQAANQEPIQPGQYYYMSLIAFLTPTTTNYTPDQAFTYSFDVVVTATQA